MSTKSQKTRRPKRGNRYIPPDSESSDSPSETSYRSLKGRHTKKVLRNSNLGKSNRSRVPILQSSESHSNMSSRRNTAKHTVQKPTSKKRHRRQNTVVVVGAPRSNESKKVIPKIVVRNPTRKVVKVLSKPNKISEGHLTPPAPMMRKMSKKQKYQITIDKNTIVEAQDALLASFPLPSSSVPQRFSKNTCIIGAINIQAFGAKKFSNLAIMRIIIDILRRYDIVFCQEIHVPNGKEGIIQQLANIVSTPSTPYSFALSRPIGRSSYQERYLYLYRKNEWKVLEDYVIDDEKMGDKFIREPYVVRFQHLRKPNVKVTLVGCHTQPENAYNEIKALVTDIYINLRKKNTQNNDGLFTLLWSYLCCCLNDVFLKDKEPIILMGDFNASGSYLNKQELSKLDGILHKNNLIWGIQHSSDTTVAAGDAAYDRFIFEEANVREWIGHTRVWRFDEAWINEKVDPILVKNIAKRITDHYPIEFELRI
ncbi:23617_t:CDS:1 [Cetraspora pellucida]|uniref:23617_t:CDS:1 n=1 Tax=Cetraspora pellucida TaxID=1433469 RepID=A0A9N9FZR9_9GLOM|nr:23617_t:CDS:1 [Cetraspora pellucida]